MNKEPIGLYIFRLMLSLGLFGFMCMLYWSSVLIEEHIKLVRGDLSNLEREVSQLIGQANSYGPLKTQLSGETFQAAPRVSSQIDPSLPNLLTEDPFYKTTLPKLLPKDFKPQGTFQRASVVKPDNLHPFNGWYHVNEWLSLCNIAVASREVGKFESLAPNMALKMEERFSQGSQVPEYWIHLRDDVYWEPLSQNFFSDLKLAPHFLKRHQVTAADFKFGYDAIMNPYVQSPGAISMRTYLQDIEEIRVIDDFTFVVRWKAQEVTLPDGKVVERIKYVSKMWTGSLRPLASFVYKYFADGSRILEEDSAPDAYRTNPVWAQNFMQHWAKNIIPSCGPWIFDGMTDRQIQFKRNPNYYNPLAALGEKIVVALKGSTDAVWQSFKSNELDHYDIQPNQLAELDQFLNSEQYIQQADQEAGIHRLDYLFRAYSYIAWNQVKVYFQSRRVRQAMTMAIDRQRIIEQNLNGMGVEVTGTFFRNSPSYDATIQPWPFDPAQAKRLLEEEGWFDSDGDGVLDKMIDGKRVRFEFALTYYVKNPTAKSIVEYVATALKQIGILCNLNGVDVTDLTSQFEEKSFDALYLSWTLGDPPEDPRQVWHSSGAKLHGSSNAIGFANPEADKIIEELQFEYNPERRIVLYHRFNAILHEEQPYTFLYSPYIVFLYRNYLENVFIPADRQDLIPGANVTEPDESLFWLKKH